MQPVRAEQSLLLVELFSSRRQPTFIHSEANGYVNLGLELPLPVLSLPAILPLSAIHAAEGNIVV